MTRKRLILIPLTFLAIVLAVSGGFMMKGLEPASPGSEPKYFRVRPGEKLAQVLDRAEKAGLLKSAATARLYNRFFGAKGSVRSGTFKLDPNKGGTEILDALLTQQPLKQMVLIREGLWTSEVAAVLDAKDVCSAKEFRVIAHKPANVKRTFLLPGKPLEGYLFPDTYDLPPLLGASDTVEKMLDAFENKVFVPMGRPIPALLRKWVIIASLIELECKKDSERPIVAGVIANRLAKNMPLQIDASLLYALQDRRRLFNKDYLLQSIYNTYRFTGLPPGPICSPGLASIRAAAKPAQHTSLYYVAMPDGSHRFAKTYAEHLANIAISRKAFGR